MIPVIDPREVFAATDSQEDREALERLLQWPGWDQIETADEKSDPSGEEEPLK